MRGRRLCGGPDGHDTYLALDRREGTHAEQVHVHAPRNAQPYVRFTRRMSTAPFSIGWTPAIPSLTMSSRNGAALPPLCDTRGIVSVFPIRP